MSGPKSSRYTLTAEQLKRIAEEQERRRRELEEKVRKERECKEAHIYLAETKAKLARHMEMMQSGEKRLPTGDDYSELHNSYHCVYSLIKQTDKICSVKTNAAHSSLMSSRKEAERLFNEIISMEEDIVAQTDNAVTERKIQEDSIIAESMKVSFDSVGIIETTEDPIFAQTIQKLEKLADMEISQELAREVNGAIAQAKRNKSVSAAQNFLSITVEPLRKRCRAFAAFAKNNKELYDSLLDKYKALCEQLGVQFKQIEFTENGLSELKKIVSNMECEVNQDAEQAYISQCVDEVMSEMGYEVIGHRQVRKKSGKEFRSKLLTYEDGTVINVTESSSGQIAMEIGGTDNKDRTPDANERVALRKNMESFCEDFREIEKRLSARGVILNERISMLPPEEAYAQIINVNDYELAESYQTMSKRKAGIDNSQKHMRNG